jgi:hypothetical protein
MDSWDIFFQNLVRTCIVAAVKELAKNAYADNKEFINNTLREILKNDKFAIEIEEKKHSGYL